MDLFILLRCLQKGAIFEIESKDASPVHYRAITTQWDQKYEPRFLSRMREWKHWENLDYLENGNLNSQYKIFCRHWICLSYVSAKSHFPNNSGCHFFVLLFVLFFFLLWKTFFNKKLIKSREEELINEIRAETGRKFRLELLSNDEWF